MGEKGLDFWGPHLGRVADLVEVDVTLDPIYVGFFDADGVMLEADGIQYLVEQFLVA